MHARASRLIVGITGASGAVYGVRLLEALRDLGIETHLVLTKPAAVTLQQELGLEVAAVRALADHSYALNEWGAPVASGSFATDGMIVAPCSIKTLSAIAYSANDNVLVRAADVTLKEGRPLLLVVRETPLHLGHLRLMTQAAEIGAIIFPPAPAFYAHPTTLADMVNHSVGRMLARLAIPNALYRPWEGVEIE